MSIFRPLALAIIAIAALGVTSASATSFECNVSDISVTSLTYVGTGCFNFDDNEQSFTFSLESTQTLNLFTTSYAPVEGGGFAPILTLFDNGLDSNYITFDAGGLAPDGCGARSIGGSDQQNTCLDAYITAVLGPGSYRLVLTQQGNSLGGSNFDGVDENFNPLAYVACGQTGASFTQCGTSNFTGQQWDSGSMFLSPNNGDPLGNNWAVTIESVAVSTPEPSTSLIGLSGLLLTFAALKLRKKSLA